MPAEFMLEIKGELRSTNFQPERIFQTFLFITHTFIFCVSGSLFLSVSVCFFLIPSSHFNVQTHLDKDSVNSLQENQQGTVVT